MLDVDVQDEVVLLVNVEGTIYALSAWCTHQGTALALGKLADSTVTCWAHLWSFDVPSGQPVYPPLARVAPGYRLRRYSVRVENEEVFVSLER
jgi:nitrite reductase/ring-hydroxylating ferredoxin subunit